MPANKNTAEATLDEVADVQRVDAAIASMERLYEAVTGTPPPPPAEDSFSPIPPEKDAAEFVTERLDRLIDALGQPATAQAAQIAATAWSPPMTAWEDSETLVVALDLAGVNRQDVKVFDDGEGLTISGQRALAAHDGMRLRLNERPLGPFQRRILLPPSRKTAGSGGEVTARLHDGVLELRIPRPKAAPANGRPVPIS